MSTTFIVFQLSSRITPLTFSKCKSRLSKLCYSTSSPKIKQNFNPSKTVVPFLKYGLNKTEISKNLFVKHSSTSTFNSKPITTSWVDFKIFDSVRPYLNLARADKPIGTWLLFWPCAWSIAIGEYASGLPIFSEWKIYSLFAIGSWIMRGAGCTINDLADKDIDNKVDRTKTRPLASGQLTVKQAVGFLALQLSAGLSVLLSLNTYSILLGASSMLLVVTYPFMKRVTYWPQAVLGLTFNWGALLGYSAVRGYCDWPVVTSLYCAGIAWTLVYDTIYAHQDKEDDQLIGVKSTALRFGEKTKNWLTLFSTTTIGGLLAAGYYANMTYPYYIATSIGAAHLAWQIYTVDINNRQDCMNKFVSNKWFGALIFGGIFVSSLV